MSPWQKPTVDKFESEGEWEWSIWNPEDQALVNIPTGYYTYKEAHESEYHRDLAQRIYEFLRGATPDQKEKPE